MLFSLTPPAAKSRSTWLDRLRSAKGFTDNAVSDLDHFLQTPNFTPNPVPPPPPPPPPPQIPLPTNPTSSISPPAPNHPPSHQLFNIVTDVLHDLFHFGHHCTHPPRLKKSSRKQPNPRICACPNSNNAASHKLTFLRSGDSTSGVEGAQVLDRSENPGEGVDRDVNLAGFSRTEVTVIDTSYELWKFEKLLYRKKNVWKVRDKKGKSEITRTKKKRKLSGSMEGDPHGGKKWKGDKKEGNAEEYQLSLNEMNRSEVDEKAPNQVGRTVEKNQTDLNFGDGNSSVILVKSIHNGRKSGTSQSHWKGSVKSKQKET